MYSEELFQEFLDNRADMNSKKINTDRAIKGLRKKLEDWHKTGYNCDAILEHAIELGWRGLFLPTGFTPSQERLRAAQREAGKQVNDLVNQMKIPRPISEFEKQKEADRRRAAGKAALEARNQAKKLLGLN